MESKKYIAKTEKRPDGYYAVITIGNEKIFEQKCNSVVEANQTALNELHRIKNL